jgi:hypothetical protein
MLINYSGVPFSETMLDPLFFRAVLGAAVVFLGAVDLIFVFLSKQLNKIPVTR